MAIPWLSLIDAGFGLVNYARSRKTAANALTSRRTLEGRAGVLGSVENRLAGVVVAALREAFDRDARRLDFEREQIEVERRRAERALKLELLRQAADREIGRLRLLAGVAAASFLGTLLIAPRITGSGLFPHVLVGLGWTMLLGALATTLLAQSKIADDTQRELAPTGSTAEFTPWLIVGALGFIALAALLA